MTVIKCWWRKDGICDLGYVATTQLYCAQGCYDYCIVRLVTIPYCTISKAVSYVDSNMLTRYNQLCCCRIVFISQSRGMYSSDFTIWTMHILVRVFQCMCYMYFVSTVILLNTRYLYIPSQFVKKNIFTITQNMLSTDAIDELPVSQMKADVGIYWKIFFKVNIIC